MYIVATKWYKQWKVFSKYKEVKRRYQPDYSLNHLQSSFPGRVANELILKSFDSYLREDNEEDQTNFIIKSNLVERYDFKLVPYSVWEIFEKEFGGQKIKRLKKKSSYSYSYEYQVKYPAVSINANFQKISNLLSLASSADLASCWKNKSG